MTPLGKVVITSGILILTLSSLMWIVKEDWHWFAAGAAIFIGSACTSIILSIETRSSTHNHTHTYHQSPRPQQPQQPHREQQQSQLDDTVTFPAITQDDWQPPRQPPPDTSQSKALGNEDLISTDPFFGKKRVEDQ